MEGVEWRERGFFRRFNIVGKKKNNVEHTERNTDLFGLECGKVGDEVAFCHQFNLLRICHAMIDKFRGKLKTRNLEILPFTFLVSSVINLTSYLYAEL